ncbi:MAG: hypothetical protein ACE5EW_04615, partial [Thermoplasmata archaeon]
MATTERLDVEFEDRLRRFFAPRPSTLPLDDGDILSGFPDSDVLVAKFHEIWGRIEEHLDV